MIDLDDAVGRDGTLTEAALAFLEARYVRALQVEDRAHIPASGPVLFVANHPGLVDTLGLFAAIGRRDLKVVALQRPFLATLPNIGARAIFTDANLGRRALAMQTIAEHVANGGCVLTFPAGQIEPDPDIGNALPALDRWPDMTRFVARLTPKTRIVPMAVRGVICPIATGHWLTRFKRTRAERDKLTAALQLIAMVAHDARPTTVSVRIGAPLDAQGIESLHRDVIARMCRLITDGDRAPVQSALADKADRRLDWRSISEGVTVP